MFNVKWYNIKHTHLHLDSDISLENEAFLEHVELLKSILISHLECANFHNEKIKAAVYFFERGVHDTAKRYLEAVTGASPRAHPFYYQFYNDGVDVVRLLRTEHKILRWKDVKNFSTNSNLISKTER